jgi:Aspartate amino-transferase
MPVYSSRPAPRISGGTVRRSVQMQTAASDFHLMWDNAYAVQTLTTTAGAELRRHLHRDRRPRSARRFRDAAHNLRTTRPSPASTSSLPWSRRCPAIAGIVAPFRRGRDHPGYQRASREPEAGPNGGLRRAMRPWTLPTDVGLSGLSGVVPEYCARNSPRVLVPGRSAPGRSGRMRF